MATQTPDDAAGSRKERATRRAQTENVIGWADAPTRKGTRSAARPAAERGESEAVALRVEEGSKSKRALAANVDERTSAMPGGVREHFVKVGREYFYPDGAKAFTDGGVKLTTPSENTQVIRDLVAIAQARGWQRITVSGSERFRKEAWATAREAGLEVKGYRAGELDEARVVRRLARATRAANEADAAEHKTGRAAQEVREPKQPSVRQHGGRLIDHGVAAYKHDPHEPMSYFVKIETERGDREIWGVDLERAFRESLSRPQVGDEVVLRAVKREPVTVKARGHGEPDGEREVATHRNRWIVEKKEFLEGRERAAKVLRDPAVAAAKGSREHPELVGAYLQMHAAELASKQFRDPQDRERFVALVRKALADSVARGDALPAVRVRAGEANRVGQMGEKSPRDAGREDPVRAR